MRITWWQPLLPLSLPPLLLLRSKQKAKLSKGFFLSLFRQMYPYPRTLPSKRIP